MLHGGDLRVPAGAATTLQEALRQAAGQAPDKGTVYVRTGREPQFQSYAQLLAEAESVLAGLRAAGLEPGDAALFQFDDHRGYMTAFWACVLGGFVPTPVAVATTYTAHNEANRKLRNAWNLLDKPVVLTDAATAPALREVRTLWNESTVRVLEVESLARHAPDSHWYASAPHCPVINLLTSGSTGVPKCVQHTNASVAARTWSAAQGRGYTTDDVSVIWMPLDHVTMVFYNIRDVFLRSLHVNAKIEDFLGNPLMWLDLLERYGATNTWAPNFAFNLFHEYADDVARGSWDLSRVREFANGGEPVIAANSHRFLEMLAPHGLRADAMAPAWGMSETCSGVTYSTQSRTDRTAGTVVVAPSSFDGDLRFPGEDERGGQDAVAFSTVGAPLPGVTVRVVDAAGAVLDQDRIGELQIRGVTMMHGYHGNTEANRAAFDPEGWFRTGDLAFVHDGQLVIAGRKKDQIVVRGANYVAHELESVVEEAEGVRVTYSAAAGIREPGEGSDRLVVFFVPTRWDTGSLTRTLQDVRTRLGREAGLTPDLIVPVTVAEFPKTASGKIQRSALVADLRAGRFADRVEQEEDTRAPDTAFFRRQWSRLEQSPERGADDGVRLVFGEPGDLPLLGLDRGRTVVVREGDAFAQESPVAFRVAPGDSAQIGRVLEEVTARYGHISTLVLTAFPAGEGEQAGPAARLAGATSRLTALAAALDGTARQETGRPLLLLLTTGAVHVRPGDKVDLGVCALPGLVRTAVEELTPFTVRQLDLPADREKWAAAVAAELADRSHSGVTAAREGLRWQPRLRPVPETEADGTPAIVPGGLYLVTGGLGGIAHDIAGYLLAAYGTRLLLVGRSAATGDKAASLAELTALGEVMYVRADAADAIALAGAVTAAESRWGRTLDGVLHLAAADVTAQWEDLEQHTLARQSQEGFAAQYAAKVAGTLAIASVLESRPAASLVLFGSVNGEFGGRSFGAYSAANTFLVGFADHWRHERGRDVRCLAWSMWHDTGMNRGRSAALAQQRGYRAIDPDDGLRAFLSATSMPHHYLLIGLDLENPAILAELATDELSTREVLVAYTAQGVDAETVHAALEPVLRDFPVPVRLVEVHRIPVDTAGAVDTTQLLLDAVPERPGGRRAYQAPATELERSIAAIWGDVLNRSSVGREDSFFDLGGNSLRATRLLARIAEELGLALTANQLYENPTVAALAQAFAPPGRPEPVAAG